jgi:hypothetical protein
VTALNRCVSLKGSAHALPFFRGFSPAYSCARFVLGLSTLRMGTTDSKAILAGDLHRMRTTSIPDDDSSVYDHLFELPTSVWVSLPRFWPKILTQQPVYCVNEWCLWAGIAIFATKISDDQWLFSWLGRFRTVMDDFCTFGFEFCRVVDAFPSLRLFSIGCLPRLDDLFPESRRKTHVIRVRCCWCDFLAFPYLQDLFSIIQPDDVRHIKGYQPRNLGKLLHHVRNPALVTFGTLAQAVTSPLRPFAAFKTLWKPLRTSLNPQRIKAKP